jgi:hypothetical protein
MVHDDDTGSHPDFDITSTDRPAEFSGEPQRIPDDIVEVIRERALHGGWGAERIREHLRRVHGTDIPTKTIRYVVRQLRRS